MLNIGGGEIALILIAALLLLGPKRLPEMARVIGKFMREFRRQTDDVRGLVEREFYKMDEEVVPPLDHGKAPAALPPAVHAEDPVDPALHPDHPAHYKDDNPPLQPEQPVQTSSPIPVEEANAAPKPEVEPPVVAVAAPQAVSREKLKEQQAAAATPPPSPEKV